MLLREHAPTVKPVWRIIMEIVIKHCGRFTLKRTEQGFCWCLTTQRGERWYWHPETRQWTFDDQGSTTEEKATFGLDLTLNHEKAGDLNQWHGTPPAHHGTARD
jgi:hypothetical protein